MSEVVKGAIDTWKGVDKKTYSRIEVVENTNKNGVVSTRTYAVDGRNHKRKQIKNIYRGDSESLDQAEKAFLEARGISSEHQIETAEPIGIWHSHGGDFHVLQVLNEFEEGDSKGYELLTRTKEAESGQSKFVLSRGTAPAEQVEIFPVTEGEVENTPDPEQPDSTPATEDDLHKQRTINHWEMLKTRLSAEDLQATQAFFAPETAKIITEYEEQKAKEAARAEEEKRQETIQKWEAEKARYKDLSSRQKYVEFALKNPEFFNPEIIAYERVQAGGGAEEEAKIDDEAVIEQWEASMGRYEDLSAKENHSAFILYNPDFYNPVVVKHEEELAEEAKKAAEKVPVLPSVDMVENGDVLMQMDDLAEEQHKQAQFKQTDSTEASTNLPDSHESQKVEETEVNATTAATTETVAVEGLKQASGPRKAYGWMRGDKSDKNTQVSESVDKKEKTKKKSSRMWPFIGGVVLGLAVGVGLTRCTSESPDSVLRERDTAREQAAKFQAENHRLETQNEKLQAQTANQNLGEGLHQDTYNRVYGKRIVSLIQPDRFRLVTHLNGVAEIIDNSTGKTFLLGSKLPHGMFQSNGALSQAAASRFVEADYKIGSMPTEIYTKDGESAEHQISIVS